MTSPTEDFFAELGRQTRIPMLARAIGTLRFELTAGRGTQCWLVRLERGDLQVFSDNGSRDAVARNGVSLGSAGVDCVVHTSRALFDDIVTGRLNALTAMLCGALLVEGDPELLVLFQRLFPGPPAQSRPEPAASQPVAVNGLRS